MVKLMQITYEFYSDEPVLYTLVGFWICKKIFSKFSVLIFSEIFSEIKREHIELWLRVVADMPSEVWRGVKADILTYTAKVDNYHVKFLIAITKEEKNYFLLEINTEEK